MKKSFLLFLLLMPLLAFTGVHKFYVSLTDIEYNPETEALQIISRVFTDDIEKLLQERYDEELYLVKKDEHPQADEFLEKYVTGKLRISVNGKERKLNYLGKEYDNDQLVLYIEIENVEPVERIAVENTILTDLFPEQKNVIKVEVGGEIKSLLLGSAQERGLLNFGK